MKKSIYAVIKERENNIKKYGSEAMQAENAKNYIDNNIKTKGFYKITTDKVNPYKVVEMLRNANLFAWASVNAVYENYVVVEVR